MKKWILAVAILGVSAFAMAASLSDGLVAYWPFDGNANDISGNGNNGSIHGATLTTDRHGDVESAMYFGSGNYIEVANSSSLNSIGSAITIAAWVKISNWHTTGQRWAALLSKGNYQYCFNLTPDDTSYGTEVGNGVKADFTGASLLGKWVHVAVSYGSDKVCRSYINGHLYKSKSCPSGSFPVSNASLIIGKHPPQALEYFIGAMDDLFIYNRALSASEIRALQYSRPSVEFSVVTYNANSNDAEGNMPEQTFDIGEKQSLSKNKFYRDGYVFQGWAVTANGEVVYKDEALITVDSDMTLYAVWSNSETQDAPEKVQLWEGGPYWATKNIGADNPWDYGLYFWWGDTTGHRPSGMTFSFSFISSNCPTYGKSIDTLQSEGWIVSKNGTYVLSPAHDAAHVQWGGSWRMPTYQEQCDLRYNKCDWTYTTTNGVTGYVVRGRGAYASNSIFLPCAGYGLGTSLDSAGSIGCCWSSVPYSDSYYAGVLHLEVGLLDTDYTSRRLGFSVRPVQGFGEEADYVIHFNANGGTGTMESQAFEEGQEQKLSKNTYRKDGYLFQGWAVVADGEVVYKDEALITVDSDMTLYAVWDNPLLTLTAESANWSNGSITLKCEDSDTSGAEHTYSLEYKDNDAWVPVNDEAATNITRASDGFAHLTDTTFWSRLGGIPTVEYRVKDENGRVSAGCVTRNRHGIVVGLSEWSQSAYGEKGLKDTGGVKNADAFLNLATLHGGFKIDYRCVNSEAKTNDVSSAFTHLATNTVPGDICVFYISTHGNIFDDGTSYLCLFDGRYTEMQLASDINRLDAANKGLAVVCIVSACHSGALFDNPDQSVSRTSWYLRNGLVQCSENVAWITASDATTTSDGVFDDFMLDYGWNKGWAEKDGKMTLYDLAGYTKRQYDGLFSGILMHDEENERQVQIEKSALLSKVVVREGSESAHNTMSLPDQFYVSATTNKRDKIIVSWDVSGGADSYFVFYSVSDSYAGYKQVKQEKYEFKIIDGASSAAQKQLNSLLLNSTSVDKPMYFIVKAINGSGITHGTPKDAPEYEEVIGWIDDSNAIMFTTLGTIDEPEGWYGVYPECTPPVIVGQESSSYMEKTFPRGSSFTIGRLPKVTRDGFTWTGWFDKSKRKLETNTVVSSSVEYTAEWTSMTTNYLNQHSTIATAANGDIATAAAMTAANGCRTVGECYALGINPEDPNDDLKISHFEIKDGKPVITLNHTEDGSGNSFVPRVKTLGKANLNDTDWIEVPESGDPSLRFFKVEVEMP